MRSLAFERIVSLRQRDNAKLGVPECRTEIIRVIFVDLRLRCVDQGVQLILVIIELTVRIVRLTLIQLDGGRDDLADQPVLIPVLEWLTSCFRGCAEVLEFGSAAVRGYEATVGS